MVLISHRKQFIYVKNVKVAGTSVEAFFERFCLDPSEPYVQKEAVPESNTMHGVRSSRFSFQDEQQLSLSESLYRLDLSLSSENYYNHMSITQIQHQLGEERTNRYFKFCVVRNPYDKVVSFYKMAQEHYNCKKSFEEFCKKLPKITDDFLRCSINQQPVMDFYIRFEYLYDDIKKICNMLDIPYDERYIPHYKKSRLNEKNYRSFYNETTKKSVYEKYKKEFDQFGYQF